MEEEDERTGGGKMTSLFNDGRLPPHFWSKVAVADNGCWYWMASRRRNDYGRFGGKDNQRASHRVAYEALVGPIPDGLQLDHLCRRTWCVNPAHLEPVTNAENTRRALAARAAGAPILTPPPPIFQKREPKRPPRLGPKLPYNKTKTHCIHGHELSGENLYVTPKGYRNCRACNAEITARRRAKTKPLAPTTPHDR